MTNPNRDDRNSITTNTASIEANERLAEELRKAFQGQKGEVPEALRSSREQAEHDNVNHPAHYTAGGIECIDAIAAALTCQTDPMHAWLTGQVFKYCWRWPLKNGLEDLKKARFYLDRLIADVERKDKEEWSKRTPTSTENTPAITNPVQREGLTPNARRLFTDILSELGEEERP